MITTHLGPAGVCPFDRTDPSKSRQIHLPASEATKLTVRGLNESCSLGMGDLNDGDKMIIHEDTVARGRHEANRKFR
jgi:hypothetical protein